MEHASIEPWSPPPLAHRTGHHLRPDSSRVLSMMFVAGYEDFGSKQSRTSTVINRVLELSDEQVNETLRDVVNRFSHRHPDFHLSLDSHAHRVANRVKPDVHISDERWRLIGAFFTHEFSVEGASLSNPSAVLHPSQDGVPDGAARWVMSVRCIGEGHRSSIGFRTGLIDANGFVTVDPPGVHLTAGQHDDSQLEYMSFVGLLGTLDDFGENAKYVLEGLGSTFTVSELEHRLNMLLHERDTYRSAETSIDHFRVIADRNYCVTFPHESDLSERVLWPRAAAEWRGMEDARFARFVEDDGTAVYYATYTAFDGVNISQQFARTDDFATFDISPLAGPAASGKGLALFPRRIDGRYVALSRADHETNSLAFSHHLEYWEDRALLQSPSRPWELIQLGNCGSPIETEAGWLVLTHGVGPMRTYAISAMLLDLDDPLRVIGTLDAPLLAPSEAERNGYVPNVVYSCGSMLHDRTLMIPFGIADESIGIATADLDMLLEHLTGT
jgi:predicted GH43/DUF377 family glycosyl hydrolase